MCPEPNDLSATEAMHSQRERERERQTDPSNVRSKEENMIGNKYNHRTPKRFGYRTLF
jgi:hypothetical protein